MNPSPPSTEEFVTIIAKSATDAMRQFKAQALDHQGFVIHGPIGPHRFSLANGESALELFGGEELVAATFSRRTPVLPR